MGKREPIPHLEYLKKQIDYHGLQAINVWVTAQLDPEQPPGAEPRYFYTVDFEVPGRGWLALTEARSQFKVRTWWNLNDCANKLRSVGVRELRVHLRFRPQDKLPQLRSAPVPTRSGRRKGLSHRPVKTGD